jgi:hypothetical protein
LREDGAHLAASKINNNFNLSTGRVENALSLHLFAISSFIGWSVFAGFVIIVASNEDVDDDGFFSSSWLLLTIIHKQ